MKRTLAVIRHEIVTTLSRPVYLFIVFGLPLVGMLVFGVMTVLRNNDTETGGPNATLKVEGYVDESGLIAALPADLPPGYLLPYDSIDAAQAALDAGDISSYYVIPADYVESGNVVSYNPDTSVLSLGAQDWMIRYALVYNLLGQDAALTAHVTNPATVQETNIAPPPASEGGSSEGGCAGAASDCASNPVVQMLPTFMVIVFFVFLTSSSGMLLGSVSGEKENRLIEILLSSVTSRQLLIGKIVGLGLVSLLQTAVWIGSGYLVVRMGGNILSLPEGFVLPVSVVIWALVLFLLGYGIYASLMAGAGALVPRLKEASQVTWVIIWPIFLAYMIGLVVGPQNPRSPLIVVLSLIPFTAPVSMMQRITVGGVPMWQILISVALQAATVVLVVLAVARMFRAQVLLSGQAFSAKRFFQILITGDAPG